MRLAARSASRAPTPELRPRWGLFAAALGGLAVVVGLLVIQKPRAPEAAAECAAVSEAAVLLGLRPVFPEVGGRNAKPRLDCRASLAAAGVPLASEPAPRTDGGAPIRRGVAFARPKIVSPDRAIVDYSLLCGPLCGSGHRAELARRGGRWEVVAHADTWIS